MGYSGDRYMSCERKVRYATLAFAEKVQVTVSVKIGQWLFLYECKYCEGYHLTKRGP